MPALSSSKAIKREILEQVAESRLKEAQVLRKAGCFAGSIYLATYAVECWLKIAICHALDWKDMLATFKTHDLKLLLLHSGLERRMKRDTGVYTSFRKIQDLLMREDDPVRYRPPDRYGEADAEEFLAWVQGDDGVITWVKKQL